MTDRMVETSGATLAVSESGSDGPPVLLIHGNSSCKEVFRNQMQGELGRRHRMIAFDLPGHGASSDAREPETVYTIPGYAALAVELMEERLGLERYAVFGWSLGGHIGIDMLSRSDRIAGLMISGTPPAGKHPGALDEAFLPSEHMGLAGKREFTDAEADAYARATAGENAPYEDFLGAAVRRTDGRARETMIAAFAAGMGESQQKIVGENATPLAIVNGAEEPFANNAFTQAQSYANLWEGKVHLLPGLGHAPFWEAPEVFDPYLERFLGEVLG